jgi:hypothetical protein
VAGGGPLALHQRAQRILEPQQVELGRVHLVRELADALERLVGDHGAFAQQREALAAQHRRQAVQADLERRERLSHVVVEVARDVAPLVFLDGQHARGKLAQPGVGRVDSWGHGEAACACRVSRAPMPNERRFSFGRPRKIGAADSR